MKYTEKSKVTKNKVLETSEIPLTDLPDEKMTTIESVLSVLKKAGKKLARPVFAWSGTGGFMVSIELEPNSSLFVRLEMKDLERLAKVGGVRWIEFRRGEIAVGI